MIKQGHPVSVKTQYNCHSSSQVLVACVSKKLWRQSATRLPKEVQITVDYSLSNKMTGGKVGQVDILMGFPSIVISVNLDERVTAPKVVIYADTSSEPKSVEDSVKWMNKFLEGPIFKRVISVLKNEEYVDQELEEMLSSDSMLNYQ